MKNKIAVFTSDDVIWNELREAGDKYSFTLERNPSGQEFGGDYFIITDVSTFIKQKNKFSNIDRRKFYVISEKTDSENILLSEENKLHHLVGFNPNSFAREVFTHIMKSNSKNIWGLKTYLEDSADIQTLSLSDSKHTNEMITQALGQFNFAEYFNSPTEYIQVMANELISNSLYKGPNRKREISGLGSADRKSPVFLKGSDLVGVTLGMDKNGVALSVQDSFGGLNYDTLIQSLKRSFVEKTVLDKKDGAGLGLYLTYLHSNQFIINLKENFRTEVICIIEKNKRYKNYKERIRSFHFFQEVQK